MILRIAYRNIWRNPLRSWILIAAIVLGIWGGLAVLGTAGGLTRMRQSNAINSYISHLQIHHPDYPKFGRLADTISHTKELLNALRTDPDIKAASPRTRIESFIQSVYGNSAVILNGIDPEYEKQVTTIHELCDTGNYLEQFKRKPPIILGERLARKLGVDIGSTIQTSFSGLSGSPTTATFKVVDLYSSSNALYDEVNAFVRSEHLESYLGDQVVHEIAIIVKDDEQVESIRMRLGDERTDLDIRSWREIAPELGYADKMMDLVMTLFLIIIMMALAFGIINTMLMAVHERKKEIGMLLAVGMNKRRIFRMIIFESLIIAAIGGPMGVILSYLSISYFNTVGIDLSFAAAGLNSVGLGSTIYPYIDPQYYLIITLLVMTTSLVSSIYPARNALRLNPTTLLTQAK